MIELPVEHRRAIRAAIWKSDFRSVAAFERATGFPCGDCRAMLRGATAFSADYYSRFLEGVQRYLGVTIPTPAPTERDVLAALVRVGRIKEPEAEAGRALRCAAEGWDFPGLHPAPELVAAWPPALRVMFAALRGADAETTAFRPPLPTCISTVWSIAVENEIPAVLGPLPSAYMARLEMASLRIGLTALVEALAAGPLENEPAHETPAFDFDAEEREAQQQQAIKMQVATAAAANMSIAAAAEASGLSATHIKTLRKIGKVRPDLLTEIEAGRMTINAAGAAAGILKSSYKPRGTKIGQPPKWPPQSAGSWKVFNAVKARDPELAARVERQELSVFAAGVACGYLKPKQKEAA